MTLDQLNRYIRETVQLVLPGLTDIVAYYPNAPRPNGTYATVNIAALTVIGNGEKAYNPSGDDVLSTHYAQMNATVSVNFYREGARQAAAEFLNALWRQEVIDLWNANGMGFIDSTDVRDLTYLLNQDHEERAQLDINVHFLLTALEEELPGILVANIYGTVDNGERVVETVEITVQ